MSACLCICLGPLASAQSPAEPPAPAASKASSLRSNPLAYHVPEAWRERARVFIDPGPKGLEGGFLLQDISLGRDIRATFRAKDESLIVRIIPAKVALESDHFRGERVGVRVEEASDGSAPALAHLVRLLKARESGWGWLRRDPNAGVRKEAAREARQGVERAERLLMVGHVERGVALIQESLQKAPDDALAHLRAARMLYKAGRPSLAKLKAEVALPLTLKGLETKGLGIELSARSRAYVARAHALATDVEGATRLTEEVLRGPMACTLTGLVKDLALVDASTEARRLAKTIAKRDPGCEEAQALRVNLVARYDSAEDAVKLADKIVSERTGLSLVRSAWACAALQTGDIKSATLQASVPVERGGTLDPATLILSAVLRSGGLVEAPLAKWENLYKRDASAAHRALMAARAFARGDFEAAEEQLVALSAATLKAPGLDAMRALSLVRMGRPSEAKAALERAWPLEEGLLWAIAAEAEVAEAEGKGTEAISVWKSYLKHYSVGLGPMNEGEVRAKLSELSGGVPSADSGLRPKPGTSAAPSKGSATTPAGEASDDANLIPSLVGLCAAFGALWWWRRSRRGAS